MEAAGNKKTSAAAHFQAGRMQEAMADYEAAAEACEAVLLDGDDMAAKREAHTMLAVVIVNQLQCMINLGLPVGDHARAAVCDDVRLLLGNGYVLSASDEAELMRRRFKSKRWWIVASDVPEECFRSMRLFSTSDGETDAGNSSRRCRSERRQTAIQQPGLRSELSAAIFGKLFGRFAEILLMNYAERKRRRIHDPLPPLQMAGSARTRVLMAEHDVALLADAQLAVLTAEKEFGMKCKVETGALLRSELVRLCGKPTRGFVHSAHHLVTLVAHPRFSSHGLAVVATGSIDAGAEMISESPALLASSQAPKGSDEQKTTTSTYEGRFAAAVGEVIALERESMSDPSAASTLEALTTLFHPNMHISEGAKHSVIDVLCDVWHHNAMRLTEIDFRINESSGREFDGSAVYITSSRLNHSCVPNALCVFTPLTSRDSPAGRLTVRLLAPVDEGDEVTISYCPTIASRATKRSHCRFDCQCHLCRSGVLDEVICPSCGEPRVWPSCDNHPSCVDDSAVAAALDAAIQQVDASTNAIAMGTNEGGSQVHLRKLLNLFTACPLLGDLHHLRFRIGLESLAAAVVASPITDQELSDALCQLAMYLDDVCGKVMAPNWPLHTGLRMHLAYCLGRHHAGMNPDSDEPTFLADARIPPLVAASFQEHVVTTGSASLQSFMLRYEVELAAVGVICAEHMDMLSRLVQAQMAGEEAES